MFDPRQLDEFADKLIKLLPKGVVEMQQDVEKNIRALLQSTFSKLDLVTREEFDVQSEVLARTRQKLEALEQKIKQLEDEKQ